MHMELYSSTELRSMSKLPLVAAAGTTILSFNWESVKPSIPPRLDRYDTQVLHSSLAKASIKLPWEGLLPRLQDTCLPKKCPVDTSKVICIRCRC